MWPAVLATPRGWPRAEGLVAGLDASENLIQVARARVTDAEFTVGDMFALPFHGCNDRPRRNRPPWTRRDHASGLRIASGLPRRGDRLGRVARHRHCWSRVDRSRTVLPALDAQRFDEELRTALAPFEVDGIGIRLPNEFGYITGTRV